MSSRRRVCSVSVELRVGSSHSRQWWECGELHRVDGGPAVEYASGYCAWWECGELHRGGGLPAVERADGSRVWYERNRLIRCEEV